jgi:hypothetical protein
MAASNRTRPVSAARGTSRRPACSPPASTPATQPPAEASLDAEGPRASGGLQVTIRVIPLPDPESNPLRARQLVVIVNLLRRAAAEAAEQDATPCDDARPPG